MSDTARDYQTNDLASTKGLEEFFEPLATLGQTTSDLAIANPGQAQATPDQIGLEIEQATVSISLAGGQSSLAGSLKVSSFFKQKNLYLVDCNRHYMRCLAQKTSR
jgi:hypothetical protein